MLKPRAMARRHCGLRKRPVLNARRHFFCGIIVRRTDQRGKPITIFNPLIVNHETWFCAAIGRRSFQTDSEPLSCLGDLEKQAVLENHANEFTIAVNTVFTKHLARRNSAGSSHVLADKVDAALLRCHWGLLPGG
jgi:hypothetical protein